jgi:hypothetical protein
LPEQAIPQNPDDVLFIAQDIHQLIPDTFSHLVVVDVAVVFDNALLIIPVRQPNFHCHCLRSTV